MEVEKIARCIKNAGSFPSRAQLMRVLPQAECASLDKVLAYLEASNKILLPDDGSIVWVAVDDQRLIRLLDRSPIIGPC